MYILKRIFGKALFTLLIAIIIVTAIFLSQPIKSARIVCGSSYDGFDFSNYESNVNYV